MSAAVSLRSVPTVAWTRTLPPGWDAPSWDPFPPRLRLRLPLYGACASVGCRRRRTLLPLASGSIHHRHKSLLWALSISSVTSAACCAGSGTLLECREYVEHPEHPAPEATTASGCSCRFVSPLLSYGPSCLSGVRLPTLSVPRRFVQSLLGECIGPDCVE